MESHASLRPLLVIMLLMGISQGFKEPSRKELMVKINSLAEDVKIQINATQDLENVIKTQGETIKALLNGQTLILEQLAKCPCSWVNNKESCDCTTRKPERDCEAHQMKYASQSGVYRITINKKVTEVYCDMETKDGGWTVLQRRVDGSQDFNLGWAEYKAGFGQRSKDSWMGLESIHQITNSDNYRVRFDMTRSDGKTGWAEYQSFKVGPETSGYKLAISGQMSGDVANKMSYHDGMQFSTKDRDNDQLSSLNCAARHKGGFWFKSCYRVHLNGVYGERGDSGIWWRGFSWYYDPTTITYIDMKIKRN